MWEFSSSTWSTIYTGAASSPVEAITVSTGTPVYFGGEVYSSGKYYSAWVYQYNTSTTVTADTGFMTSTSASKLDSLTMSSTTVYAGGIDSTGQQGQAWSYDISSGTWTSLNITDTNISEVMSVLYSSVQAYLFDAVTNTGSGSPYAQVQYYNGTAWTDTGLPTSSSGTTYLVTVNSLAADSVGAIYAGGIDSLGNAAVWKYAGGVWTALAAPASPGQIYALSFNNEGVLFAGGVSGTNTGQVWYFNTGTSTWVSMNLTGSTLVQSMTINSSDVLYAGGLSTDNSSGIWSMSANIS